MIGRVGSRQCTFPPFAAIPLAIATATVVLLRRLAHGEDDFLSGRINIVIKSCKLLTFRGFPSYRASLCVIIPF